MSIVTMSAVTEKSYTMRYADTGLVEGADHPQVDTGLGFTCDEDMLDIVLALHTCGIYTTTSCQDPDIQPFLIHRSFVRYTHKDPHKLLDFCLYLKQAMVSVDGFQQHLRVDNYAIPRNQVLADTYYIPDLQLQLIEAIREYKE